ncbi:MAG TPA: DUF3293 domain-containing protein [Gemmatimonadales bacterium]|nr:DUF3293 domain-containing protein [Gemmatimonadales bacterium]
MSGRRNEWSEAFARTILEFDQQPRLSIDLRRPVDAALAAALRALGLGERFAVITASNPRGRLVAAGPNERRRQRLRERIDGLGAAWRPADGISADGGHRERGFAVRLALEEAQALAAEFEQLALFWFDGEAFSIVPVLAKGPVMRLPQ